MMVQSSYALVLLISSLLAVVPAVRADGLYTKNSPVLQVNNKNYDRFISNSNHSSVRKFFSLFSEKE